MWQRYDSKPEQISTNHIKKGEQKHGNPKALNHKKGFYLFCIGMCFSCCFTWSGLLTPLWLRTLWVRGPEEGSGDDPESEWCTCGLEGSSTRQQAQARGQSMEGRSILQRHSHRSLANLVQPLTFPLASGILADNAAKGVERAWTMGLAPWHVGHRHVKNVLGQPWSQEEEDRHMEQDLHQAQMGPAFP